MPVQWCSHPMAHFGTTKIGLRPSHPKGDRKVNGDLTVFIKESYDTVLADETRSFQEGDFLCRTCYEKECVKFNFHKSLQTSVEARGDEKMDIDNQKSKRQCRINSVLEASINDNSLFDESLESSFSQSSTKSEDSDHVEYEYKQEKAKHILNEVFAALNIPPITDTRITGVLKRGVTKAIEMIRQAADDICHVPSVKTAESKIASLTVDDSESLLSGLKQLFDSSDYDEQVRLLTLSPSNWGRVQIEKFFSCDEWQARRALELRSSFGILATPTNFSGNPRIDPLLVDEIQSFYQDDAISRQTSNKKEVLHINKQPIPIRYMSMTVGQAYMIFLQKLRDKNSLHHVCKATFHSLKPKWVKILTPHDVCACIYHENFDLLIQAWNKLGLTKIESKKLVSDMICQQPTEQCFFDECKKCAANLPSKFLEIFLNDQVSVFDDSFWMMWKKSTSSAESSNNDALSNDTKISLQKINGSVADLLQEFDSQWKVYVRHSYITSQQSDYIRKIKEKAAEKNTVIVHIDFAENHALINQKAIMQAHWATPQATLFTIQLTVNGENHHSMVIISDYLVHDVEFVHAAQGIITDYVRSIYPAVKRLNYVSDGAPQHFKNNKSILNLTYHQIDFGVPASWTFSATAHGKGAVDGIGAAVKYRATKKVLSGKATDAILTPEDLFKFAQQDTKINVFYLDKKRIKQNSDRYKLQSRWTRDKVEGWVNQIRSQHQFDPAGIKRVYCRRTSTSSIVQTSLLID